MTPAYRIEPLHPERLPATARQRMVYDLIIERPGISVDEIATATARTYHPTYKTIQSLRRKGWLADTHGAARALTAAARRNAR